MTEKLFWPSRWIFILAAIGSAAGLGNLWRFPALAFEHGGGAFVLAIIIANLVIGIPLLLLEVGLGQKMQKGTVQAFAGIKSAFRYVGWAALIMGFIVLSYYMAVVAWGLDYFGAAFTTAWGDDTKAFFFENVLQLSEGVGTIGGISFPVLAAFIVGWILVYFSVWKGVKSVSAVVKWTATLPFLILFILVIRAVTLEGAGIGISQYLIPQWGALLDPQLWLAAFSQVFFSLSLAFGIMIAYASLNRRENEIVGSVIWIAVGNFFVSFLSGLVVFGTLGYMALQQGVVVSDVVAGGPSLVFVVLPQAINLLPAFNALFAVIFFGMLLTLAIDSAFSLLEALSTTFRDRFPEVSTKKITMVLSLVGMVAGLIFTTKAGLYFLDIVDHFVVNYGLIIIGLLEAVIVGWLWKIDEFTDYINAHSDIKVGALWQFSIKFIIPIFLSLLLVWNLINEFKEPYEGYPVEALIWLGVVPLLAVPFAAMLLDKLVNGHKT